MPWILVSSSMLICNLCSSFENSFFFIEISEGTEEDGDSLSMKTDGKAIRSRAPRKYFFNCEHERNKITVDIKKGKSSVLNSQQNSIY